MSEPIEFDAILRDAISAPLTAIAENLGKVAEQMAAMTEAMTQGFEQSTTSSELLQESVDTLQGTMTIANERVAALSESLDATLLPAIQGVTAGMTELTGVIEENSITELYTQESLDNVAKSAGTLEGAMGALQGTVNTTNGDLITVADELNNTASVMFGLEGATATLTGAVGALTGSVGGLAGSLGATAGIIDDNTIATDANTIATDAEATAAGAAAAAAAALSASMSSAAAANSRMAASGQAAAAGLKDEEEKGAASAPARSGGYGAVLGATMLLGMAGAAARVGVNLIKSGMDGESALNRVAAMAGASSQDIDTFRSTIESWAGTLGKTTSDLANGLYDIVSVGYNAKDALTILKYAAESAAAGQVDLHTVTNGVTAVMKAYGMQASDAALATGILVTGVREGKANFADYSRAIGLVGEASKAANINMKESAAALSTLTAVWPTVRQAGQNLRSLIQDLSVNYDGLTKRAADLNLSFDQTAFTHIPTLQGKLEYLWKAAKENEHTFRELLGNKTDYTAADALVNQYSKDFQRNLNNMQGALGATDAAFKTHEQTMQAHIDNIKGAWSALAMQVSAVAEPMINAALGKIADEFGKLSDWIEKHSELMKPILIGLATLIGSVLVGAIFALGAALDTQIATALAVAAPVSGLILLFAGLVALFKRLYDTSVPFRQAVDDLGGALKTLWTTALQPLIEDGLKWLVSHLNGLVTWFDNLFGSVKKVEEPANSTAQAVGRLNQHFGEAADNLHKTYMAVETVRGPLSPLLDLIHKVAGGVREFAKWLAPTTIHIHEVIDPLDQMTVRVRTLHNHLEPTVKVIDRTVKVASPLGRVLHDAGEGALHIAEGIGKLAMVLGIGGSAGLVTAFAVLAHNSIVFHLALAIIGAGIKDAITNFSLFLNGIRTIGTIFIGFLSMAARAGGPLGLLKVLALGIADGFSGIAGAIGGILAAAAPFIAIFIAVAAILAAVVTSVIWMWQNLVQFRQVVHSLLDVLGDLWNMLKGQIVAVWEQLKSTFENSLKPAFVSLQNIFYNLKPALIVIGAIIVGSVIPGFIIFVSILRGVIQAIGSILVGVIQFIGGLIQVVAGIIEFFSAFTGIFRAFIDLFRFGPKKALDDLVKMFQSMGHGIQQVFGGLGNMILGIWNATIGAVIGLVVGFISGVIGWFVHLFERLVGHSIVTDIKNGIIAAFKFLLFQVPLMIGQLVLNLLLKFGELEIKGIQFILSLVGKIISAIINFAITVVKDIATFVINVLLKFGELELKGIQFILSLVGKIISTVISFIANVIGKIIGFVLGILSWFANLELRGIQAIINFVGKIKEWFGNLVDGGKKLLGGIFTWMETTFGGLPGKAITWMTNFVNSILNTLGNMKDKVIGAITNLIPGPLKNLVGFGSPTKEGPGREADQWMPNLVNMLVRGLEAGQGPVGGAAAKLALGIHNAINGGVTGSASGAGYAGVLAANSANTSRTSGDVHIHLDGGLGAGLQLLDPVSRRRLMRQIGGDFVDGANLQGVKQIGYSGY